MQTTSQTKRDAEPGELDAAFEFRRILVPVDFGPGSRRALAIALELQRRFGSEVCLFNLTEPGGADEFLAGLGDSGGPRDLVAQAEERLRRFVDNVFPGQSRLVVCKAQVGADIVHAIDRAAKQCDATLVILGDHPHQAVFRTPVEKIAQELEMPVMLVRREKPAPTEKH